MRWNGIVVARRSVRPSWTRIAVPAWARRKSPCARLLDLNGTATLIATEQVGTGGQGQWPMLANRDDQPKRMSVLSTYGLAEDRRDEQLLVGHLEHWDGCGAVGRATASSR